VRRCSGFRVQEEEAAEYPITNKECPTSKEEIKKYPNINREYSPILANIFSCLAFIRVHSRFLILFCGLPFIIGY